MRYEFCTSVARAPLRKEKYLSKCRTKIEVVGVDALVCVAGVL